MILQFFVQYYSAKESILFHIVLHFAVPLVIALVFFRSSWQKSFFIMSATIIVDIDHLLATPIYDPLRCSIGFHPLHTTIPIIIYALLTINKKFRLIGIGLLVHMALDAIDCYFQ